MIRRFLDQPVWVRVLRGLLLAAILALAAFAIPTPYMLEAPGRTVPVSQMVSVRTPKAHPVNGEFLMTTVVLERATVMLCLYSVFDRSATLTRAPKGAGDHAQSPAEGGQMELSQYYSTRVALEKLGYKVDGTYLGLRITQVDKGSPNTGTLKAGDLLLDIEGKAPPNIEDLRALTGGKTAADTLSAQIERNGKTESVELALKEVQGSLRIGVLLRPEYGKIKLPIEVAFHSGNTVGASAGLVFALEIFDQLSPRDLAQGRVIAATGTLYPSGRVGPIEGLRFKLVSAERAGATLFLVPRENWEEVKNEPTSMKVIPVSTFQEALDALR